MAASESETKTQLAHAAALVDQTVKALGIEPSDARSQTDSATVWTLKRGSAAMAIFVRPPREHEESGQIRVIAPIVTVDPAHATDLYKYVLQLNAGGLSGVAFGLHEDRVVAVSERPVRDLDLAEVQHIVRMVGAVADHYDDQLVKRFGGRRASD